MIFGLIFAISSVTFGICSVLCAVPIWGLCCGVVCDCVRLCSCTHVLLCVYTRLCACTLVLCGVVCVCTRVHVHTRAYKCTIPVFRTSFRAGARCFSLSLCCVCTRSHTYTIQVCVSVPHPEPGREITNAAVTVYVCLERVSCQHVCLGCTSGLGRRVWAEGLGERV